MVLTFIYSILVPVFVFGVLILVHEFGHFLLAKKNGVRVEKFSFGFGPKLLSKKVGETEYIISAIPFIGGYIKMAGDEPGRARAGASWEFLSKSCGQRAQIIAFGPTLNYLLAYLVFSLIFVIGSPVSTTKVGKLLEGYPAAAAGIKENDVILTVDGEKVEYWQDMAALIQQKTEGKITIGLNRAGEILQLKVQPKIEEYQDLFGRKTKIGLVGISASEETVKIKYGWAKSFYKGGEKLINLTVLTYQAFWSVLTRHLPFKESFAGPIFMFKLAGNAARMGWVPLLNLLGLFSMALAIFNFLPLPVLDGGHLFFLLLEKLRKRPISTRIQEVAAQIGMLALVTLLLFVSYFDLVRSGWWR